MYHLSRIAVLCAAVTVLAPTVGSASCTPHTHPADRTSEDLSKFASCLRQAFPCQDDHADLASALRRAGFGPLGAPQAAPWRNTRQVWIRPPAGSRAIAYAAISISPEGVIDLRMTRDRYPAEAAPER